MLHIGLDSHYRTSTICILDANGKEVNTKTIAGSWAKLMDELDTLTQPFAICFEASCGYGHLYDQLARRAVRVTVAHPGQLRLIFRSKRKNDRVDARKLAKLLFLDEVPEVHVPGLDVRQWREMISHRQHVVGEIVACKNGLRALLRMQGITPPKGLLWAKAGRAWLATAEMTGMTRAVRRDMYLDKLEMLESQLARVTSVLDEIAKHHPGVSLLKTIPGVGPRTAEAVVAHIDDPRRFTRVRQIGAYFGLVPCQNASAGKNRLGHITKDGPRTVRKLLVEAAWQLVRRCPSERVRFDRLVGGKKERRKIAVVAVAHHLLRSMLSMLRSGETWRGAVASAA